MTYELQVFKLDERSAMYRTRVPHIMVHYSIRLNIKYLEVITHIILFLISK